MFYEELPFLDFDVAKLQVHLRDDIFPLGKQIIQGEEYETPKYHGFGGWSITSRTGSWMDGWDFFQSASGEALEAFFPSNSNNFKALKYFNIAHSMEHKNPTQACVGEIASVVKQIEELGLTPRRVRVTCLKAGCKSLVHTDGEETEYIARIHIPLITNPKCVFISEGQNLYMQAGKAYMVWVNKWHQIRNDSDQDRYHIIMDAYDTKGVTQGFKYNGDIQELEAHAALLRKNIDDTDITPEEYAKYEAVRQTFVTKKV